MLQFKRWFVKTEVVVYGSVFIALVLTVFPLPLALQAFRPDWLLLVVVYWGMQLAPRYQVGFAWGLGLLEDALVGTLLGVHALQLALSSYVIGLLHRRLRHFPLWQQSLAVLLIAYVGQLVIYCCQGLAHHPPQGGGFWLVPILTAMLWTWWTNVLSEVMVDSNLDLPH